MWGDDSLGGGQTFCAFLVLYKYVITCLIVFKIPAVGNKSDFLKLLRQTTHVCKACDVRYQLRVPWVYRSNSDSKLSDEDGDAERKGCCRVSPETQNHGAPGEPEQPVVLLPTRF